LKCYPTSLGVFGENAEVKAERVSSSLLTCKAPFNRGKYGNNTRAQTQDALCGTANPRAPYCGIGAVSFHIKIKYYAGDRLDTRYSGVSGNHSRILEVRDPVTQSEGFRGVRAGSSSSYRGPVDYYYYQNPDIIELRPDGGPTAGMTPVYLTLKKIDGYLMRLVCKYQDRATGELIGFVNGTVSDVSASPDGPVTRVLCPSPRRAFIKAPVKTAVFVSLNGQDFNDDFKVGVYQLFTYYEHPRIEGVLPGGGPIAGNTIVTLYGKGFGAHAEALQCRFQHAAYNASSRTPPMWQRVEVNATVKSDTEFLCVVPPVSSSKYFTIRVLKITIRVLNIA
jgi:hypothetical protein